MNEFEKNPNPTKDQHFMIDKNLIEYICRKANIQSGDNVVEIGGGSGALTEVLATTGNQITVIELDHYYAEMLKEKYRKFKNVKVIEGNALNYSYIEYDRIISNLPYSITEPFFIKLAKTGALNIDSKDRKSSSVKSITLVVSQNSARKMLAPIQISEGNNKHFNLEFGLISAICKTYLEVDIDRAIPSSAFYPEPAVTSFLVNLTPKNKKTTVDRIMSEILMDKTEKVSSIEKVYQTMLAQGKIYKMSKHKGYSNQKICPFTSKTIRNLNIYALSNAQISQLIKDLIKNDLNMKGMSRVNNTYRNYDRYDSCVRFEENDFDEETNDKMTKWKKKSETIYSYFYDDVRYNVLLHRGLEFIETAKLKEKLQNNS